MNPIHPFAPPSLENVHTIWNLEAARETHGSLMAPADHVWAPSDQALFDGQNGDSSTLCTSHVSGGLCTAQWPSEKELESPFSSQSINDYSLPTASLTHPFYAFREQELHSSLPAHTEETFPKLYLENPGAQEPGPLFSWDALAEPSLGVPPVAPSAWADENASFLNSFDAAPPNCDYSHPATGFLLGGSAPICTSSNTVCHPSVPFANTGTDGLLSSGENPTFHPEYLPYPLSYGTPSPSDYNYNPLTDAAFFSMNATSDGTLGSPNASPPLNGAPFHAGVFSSVASPPVAGPSHCLTPAAREKNSARREKKAARRYNPIATPTQMKTPDEIHAHDIQRTTSANIDCVLTDEIEIERRRNEGKAQLSARRAQMQSMQCLWDGCQIWVSTEYGKLRDHLRNHHHVPDKGEVDGQVKCRWPLGNKTPCGKWMLATSLVKHLSSMQHLVSSTVICAKCNRSFSRQDAFARHLPRC